MSDASGLLRSAVPPAPERIRLVIWDLDETFWSGTLTEGGLSYSQQNHDSVIALAKRGILSSICSKNDFDRVKDILLEAGIWEYFVFPSISWSPKGPRIAEIIAASQLRAETVMLIDDNPSNLNEARHFCPKLRISDISILPNILDLDVFQGKSDDELMRLAQYKLLEKRARDLSSSGDNRSFLRASQIRVFFEFDIERHMDRAIELINRTNQLNFTKRRLPECAEQAADKLRELLRNQNVQAGLVRVRDNYGDYGIVGLYVIHRFGTGRRLVHYCFSCRTLGMLVETWCYQRLGCPDLRVVGEVLTDLFDQSKGIDWISMADGSFEDGMAAASVATLSCPVFARGGCDMAAIMHYFTLAAERVVTEFNIMRGEISVRIDHSLMARYAINPPPDLLPIATALGYDENDFGTGFFAPERSRSIRIFSCWIDANIGVYRHRRTGILLPFAAAGLLQLDFTEISESDLSKYKPPTMRAIEFLRAEFDYCGVLDQQSVRENLITVFRALSSTDFVYVLLALEGLPGKIPNPQRVLLNKTTREVLAEFPNVVPVDIARFINDADEVCDLSHFNRAIYFRLYRFIHDDYSVKLTLSSGTTGADKVVAKRARESAGALIGHAARS